MTTAVLSVRVDDWIYGRLDATNVPATNGRRHIDDTAPMNVLFPYAQFSLLSGVEVLGLNGTRIIGRFVYIVQAIARTGSWDAVEAAADQIYASLHQKTGTATGVVISSSICEEEVRRAEIVEGVRWRYLGWRVRIEAISA